MQRELLPSRRLVSPKNGILVSRSNPSNQCLYEVSPRVRSLGHADKSIGLVLGDELYMRRRRSGVSAAH